MTDRRKRKTQQAVQTAFAKLISNKDIKDITIKELCEEADINKSTFYLHYRDIYDCADSFMNYAVDKTIEVIEPYDFTELINHMPEIIEKTLDIFRENRDLYVPFFNSPRHSFSMYKTKQLIIKKLLEKAQNDEKSRLVNKSSISFIVCGLFGVLEQIEFDEINPEITSVLTSKIQNGFIPSKDAH